MINANANALYLENGSISTPTLGNRNFPNLIDPEVPDIGLTCNTYQDINGQYTIIWYIPVNMTCL